MTIQSCAHLIAQEMWTTENMYMQQALIQGRGAAKTRGNLLELFYDLLQGPTIIFFYTKMFLTKNL